jgi:putative hydrolase
VADSSQPEEPEEPENTPIPGFPGFLFGGAGGDFDPSKIDFSQIDLGQVMRLLQSTGPVNWEIARQTAEWVALEGKPEPPVSARDREQFEELAHAAQTLVVGETGLTATFATALATVGPKGWVDLHLVALRPVLEAMAATLGEAMQQVGDDDEDDPTGAGDFPGMPGMAGLAGMGNMMGLLAPALLGVQAGSMIGYLAQHALGRYDLPLPTGRAPVGDSPGGDAPTLCFVVPNVDAFEAAWSLPRDDLRFYVALHETVHAATRSVPWVRGRLVRLAVDYVSSYEIDPSAFEAEFGMIDPQDPEAMQRMRSRRGRSSNGSPRSSRDTPTTCSRRSAGGSSQRSTRSTRRCNATASNGARPNGSSRVSSG